MAAAMFPVQMEHGCRWVGEGRQASEYERVSRIFLETVVVPGVISYYMSPVEEMVDLVRHEIERFKDACAAIRGGWMEKQEKDEVWEAEWMQRYADEAR